MTNSQKRKAKLAVVSLAILAKAQELTKITLEHEQVASEQLKQFLIDVQSLTRPLSQYKPGKKSDSSKALLKIFGVSTPEELSGATVTGADVFARTCMGEGWEKKFIRRGANISITAGEAFIDNLYTFEGLNSEKIAERKAKSKARREARKAKEAANIQ